MKGNMYDWVDKTINFIGGACPHNCEYCYVQHLRFPKTKERYFGKLKILEKEFEKPLGKNKTIFVGSCIDMFSKQIPKEWIIRVLDYCKQFDNTYLFQTKNPKRLNDLKKKFPDKVILGTTIETNRRYKTKAPLRLDRAIWMERIEQDKFVSIEPIMDFDLDILVSWIEQINPKFVSIGSDSKGHKLVEPDKEMINALIKELRKFTKVKIKDNLKRLR